MAIGFELKEKPLKANRVWKEGLHLESRVLASIRPDFVATFRNLEGFLFHFQTKLPSGPTSGWQVCLTDDKQHVPWITEPQRSRTCTEWDRAKVGSRTITEHLFAATEASSDSTFDDFRTKHSRQPTVRTRVKMQTTSKNTQRYYTTKRLIRDFLSNTPICYVCSQFSHNIIENVWKSRNFGEICFYNSLAENVVENTFRPAAFLHLFLDPNYKANTGQLWNALQFVLANMTSAKFTIVCTWKDKGPVNNKIPHN